MSRSFTIPAACFTLAVSLGACASDNGDGIFITKNLVAGANCTFDAGEGAAFLPHGTFSVHSNAAYRFHPQMKSRITATAAQTDARTILLRGARVELSLPDTSVLSAATQDSLRASGVMKFTALFAAPLPPNGGLSNGEFDLIPTAVVDQIVMAKGAGILAANAPSFRTEVLATVSVFGDLAGDEAASQDFQYPVTICNDCVANELGACPLPKSTVVRAGNSCNPYQDGIVDCCRMGNDVICPGVVATAVQ